MKFTELDGDLLDPAHRFEALAHGVNLQGRMGAGIALTIRNRWPGIFDPYQRACADGSLTLGGILPFETREPDVQVIYNCATQIYPGRHAQLHAIAASITAALDDCAVREIATLGLPQIGTGFGGLAWGDVRSTISQIVADHLVDATVVRYRPAGD